MNIVLVKLSSMGDIIHALAVVNDIKRVYPEATITWVVDQMFSELLSWHPHIDHVIVLPMRAWSKNLLNFNAWKALCRALNNVKKHHYDCIIDLQGLLKTAILCLLFRGKRHGPNRHSAREPLASLFYQARYSILTCEHAVKRNRLMVQLALQLPTDLPLDYGLNPATKPKKSRPYLMFFHGTTWPNKHWPTTHWTALAQLAVDAGYRVYLPSSNAVEAARAEQIASVSKQSVMCLPQSSLTTLKETLQHASGVVTLDSGLGHLAAALSIPSVAIFGPTDPNRSRPYGLHQTVCQTDQLPCVPCIKRFCRISKNPKTNEPPCMLFLSALSVWQTLASCIKKSEQKA